MTVDPTRLVDDPDVAGTVAGDLREAIELGLTGAEQPAGGIMERLNTSISVLEDDVDDIAVAGTSQAPATRPSMLPMAVGVAVLLAAAVLGLLLLLG